MALEIKVVGNDHDSGDLLQESMHKGFATPSGPVVYTNEFLEFEPIAFPFLNPQFGFDMNQNVSFGGTPELIHDGGDNTGWTAVVNAGAWNFTDTTNPDSGAACFSITAANNNDQASFSDVTETDMSGRTAVTGRIRLETYLQANNSIFLQLRNNGADIGDPVNLNFFINAGSLNAYQSFVIAKSNFNLPSDIVDEITVTSTRTGGSKPTFRVDLFQIEETGSPATFTVSAPFSVFHIDRVVISIADNISSTVIGGTMLGLSYDKFMGLSALLNGVGFQCTINGDVLIGFIFSTIGQFITLSPTIRNTMSDGTNTFITIEINFTRPFVIRSTFSDSLAFIINDDLSGLLQFNALAVGHIEGNVALRNPLA